MMKIFKTLLLISVFTFANAGSFDDFRFASIWSDQQSSSNVTCLFEFCARELTACMVNSDCIKATVCVLPCGSDQECVMHCMINYGNDILTNFLSCASSEHSCVVMPPQEPPYQCSIPKTNITSFEFKALAGDWQVVLGLNPVYDCYPCQLTTFGPINPDGSKDALMNYQAITDDGTLKSMHQKSHLIPDPKNSELIHLTSNDFGNTLEDDWLVLQYEPNKLIMIYYCGKIPTGDGHYWFYEGGVVYVKPDSPEEIDYEAIMQSAANAGLPSSDWCLIESATCN